MGRFISADTVVPGSASGGMDGVALKPLTVDFHEGGFQSKLNQENRLGFWFQLSDKERQQAGSPWGPGNAQALNRYSYVQNNPLRWVDPSGHQRSKPMKKKDLDDFDAEFDREMDRIRTLITIVAIGIGAAAGMVTANPVAGVGVGLLIEASILLVNEQSASVKNFMADIEDVMDDDDTVVIIDTGRSLYAVVYNADGSVKTTVRPEDTIWSGAVRNGVMAATRNFDR